MTQPTLAYIFKSSCEQTLGALRGILAAGRDHARERGIDETVLLTHRLYPDMFHLTRQVQIACDTAARGAARLAGLEMPVFPDTETDFSALIDRCGRTLAYVGGVDDAPIEANALVTLDIPIGPSTMPMQGRAYVQGFVLPNLHFHAAIAYAILRTQGVVLGKRDFLVPA